MNSWTLKHDPFSELYSILDEHGLLVCEHVGKAHAERIVEAVNNVDEAYRRYRENSKLSSVGYVTPPCLPYPGTTFMAYRATCQACGIDTTELKEGYCPACFEVEKARADRIHEYVNSGKIMEDLKDTSGYYGSDE